MSITTIASTLCYMTPKITWDKHNHSFEPTIGVIDGSNSFLSEELHLQFCLEEIIN
jgi:hypothetical protein